METGTVLFETWVPTGGFRLERRKGKTPEGTVITTDWLVPAWAHDDLTATHPCAEQPVSTVSSPIAATTKCSGWPVGMDC